MMNYASMHSALLDWVKPLVESGWLPERQLLKLDRLEQQRAESLFRNRSHRPLLVALFGGTGVGKSSLLNRLAGQPIARTGLERPTSHEVTLYLHRDFQLDLLPADLPMEQTRIAYHNEDHRRLLAWIDMPDMDSTALGNRQLVEAWLPYIDWVLYVVSPERYHDDLGWRFLQQRGRRHAWLFVMNHWDQGRPEQFDDFRRRLGKEGFGDPLVLRTSCIGDADDDFMQLEQHINQAIRQHSLELLQQLGLRARIEDLNKELLTIVDLLGAHPAWQQAHTDWMVQLDTQLQALRTELLQNARKVIARLCGKQTGLDNLSDHFEPLLDALLGERQQNVLETINLDLLNGLYPHQLPGDLFDSQLGNSHEQHSKRLRGLLVQHLEAAQAKPGHWFQRGLHSLSQQLEWALPLIATLWAIQHTIGAYWRGTQGSSGFLGIDFAVHSLLLIALGWLLPRLLKQRLEAKPASVLQQGLKSGLVAFCDEIHDQHQALWAKLSAQRTTILKELQQRFLDPLQQRNTITPVQVDALTPAPDHCQS
jgi:hypothetical protein